MKIHTLLLVLVILYFPGKASGFNTDSLKPTDYSWENNSYFFNSSSRINAKGKTVCWNLFGPDLKIHAGRHFSFGLTTSWLAAPIIGSLRLNFKIAKNIHAGGGLYAATGSWYGPEFTMAMPYVLITAGSERNNITVTSAYLNNTSERNYYSGGGTFVSMDLDFTPALINRDHSRPLFGIAAQCKIGEKTRFITETYIVPGKKSGEWYERHGMIFFFSGIGVQKSPKSAFRAGIGAIGFTDGWRPVPFGRMGAIPLPFVQWTRALKPKSEKLKG